MTGAASLERSATPCAGDLTRGSLLSLAGVTKRFPGVVALDDVQLDISAGEIHALVGENGAGKSTLIKVLSGVHQPDAGVINVRGAPVELRSPARAQTLGIVTIHQEHTLAPDLSPIENIFLGRELTRGGLLDHGAMRRKASRLWMEFGGASADLDRPVNTLGGLRQRLIEIIKALTFDASLVIMDEPTAALPDGERGNLLAQIRRMRDAGVSVLLVTHRLEELVGLADRVTVFRDGRFVATEPMAGLTVPRIVHMMVGRDLSAFARAARGADATMARAEILAVGGLRRSGVLHDVSFVLHAGEVLGVAGLAGSGRTELMRAIIGADPIDGGTVMLAGEPARLRSPAAAIAAGIAMVPEERKTLGIVAGTSVARNITISALHRVRTWSGTIHRQQERAIAETYVRDLRIKTPGIGQAIEFLSGGNQQKVLFARALYSGARVIIVDEPTQGIDVGAKGEVYRLIRDFVSRGGAVLVVSSELPELFALCDRVLVMREGGKAGEVDIDDDVFATPERADRLQRSIMTMATGGLDVGNGD